MNENKKLAIMKKNTYNSSGKYKYGGKFMKRKICALILVALTLMTSMAGCVSTATTEGGEAKSGGIGNYASIIIFVVIIAVFYFFMIRPENKKKKELAAMRKEITVGDDIITIGGITGTVCEVEDEYLVIESSEDRVRIRIAKWAISTKQK